MEVKISELVYDAATELEGVDETMYEQGGFAHPLGNPEAGGSARWANWVEPAMNVARDNTSLEKRGSGTQLANVFRTLMVEYWPGRELTLGEHFGALEAIAHRWIVGEIGEDVVRRADDRTFTDYTGHYETVRKAERDDADLITEDGTTIQVKTEDVDSKPSPSKIGDADELWWVPKERTEDGLTFHEPEQIA